MEDIAAAEAQYETIRSGALPRLGFLFTDRFQDAGGGGGESGSLSARRERPEAGFYGRQVLFAGLREFAAMSGQKAEIEGRERAVEQARLLLYQDVARVFFDVAEFDKDIESLETLVRVSEDRVAELEKRLRIGRSRESEVLSTQSQVANLESRLQAARGYRAAALEALRSITRTLLPGVKDTFPPAAPSGDLADYLDRLPGRPDVRAAQAALSSRQHFSSAARRVYWPTLNLGGNYYVKRVGSLEPIDWDLLFSLDAPLFTGGETRGGVRRAESDERAAALELSRVLRLAEEEVRRRHTNLVSYLAQVEKLERSAVLAEKNHAAQQREYALGLVNNLDVLAALNTWQEARSAYERTRLEAKNAALLLELAVGNLPGAEAP
jgi:outer membrane protein TolC